MYLRRKCLAQWTTVHNLHSAGRFHYKYTKHAAQGGGLNCSVSEVRDQGLQLNYTTHSLDHGTLCMPKLHNKHAGLITRQRGASGRRSRPSSLLQEEVGIWKGLVQSSSHPPHLERHTRFYRTVTSKTQHHQDALLPPGSKSAFNSCF